MSSSGRRIAGVQVLLCTPMAGDGSPDMESAAALVDHVLGGGVDGIILLGSTGEFFALSEFERMEFIEGVIPHVAGRVPVGVCPGQAGTEITIRLARHAEKCGADYLLLPVPYYFSNTQQGITDFFARVARSVSIPVMPYDGGGGIAIDLDTWRDIVAANENIRLAKITVPQPAKIRRLHREFNGRVTAFGGSDQTILLSLAYGAGGLTVAGANVVPRAFAEMFRLYTAGRVAEARCIYYRRISPMNVISVPVHTEFIQCYKQALYWMGIIANPFTRGPMMPLDEERKAELLAALQLMEVPLARERI